MPTKDQVFDTIVDNEARCVLDIRLPEREAGSVKGAHNHALLVGMDDGGGALVADDGARRRYLPVARGRVDWLGSGQLEVKHGRGIFGRALLIELRQLPRVEGL